MTHDPFEKCRRDLGVIIDKHDEICRMQDRALKVTTGLFLAIGGMTAVAIAAALPGIASRLGALLYSTPA